GKPIELVLTQQEIASKIQQALQSRGGGEISGVGVQLQEGGALITGSTSLGGATVPIQASAQLSAASGMLGVNVTSVKTASVELPQPIRDQLLQRVQQAVGLNDLQRIDVGINVQSVQVTPTQVRISGLTK
ncbi:MAG TPA: LmeA family phospholipid-binding protein, partial [Chloroflexota bacterium]